MELTDQIETLARWIHESEQIVVFTGAGVSTESGVPDYRGPDGVWTRRDKGLPPPRMTVPWSAVEPNPAHYAIVELQEMGKLRFLISQNVDNLHLKSGIRPHMIAELHGNSTLMKCLECDSRFGKGEIGWDDRVWGKGYRTQPVRSGQPKCPDCGGRIISSVVNFGDPMPPKEMALAEQHSSECDLFLVIGSSLVVYPAAAMPRLALEAGARLVIINKGETPYDEYAHLRVEAKAGVFLSAVMKHLRELREG
jgi:NAD-dependent SIR2 family protein deacetylase